MNQINSGKNAIGEEWILGSFSPGFYKQKDSSNGWQCFSVFSPLLIHHFVILLKPMGSNTSFCFRPITLSCQLLRNKVLMKWKNNPQMGENICKWFSHPGSNHQNTKKILKALCKKTIQTKTYKPIKKWVDDLSREFCKKKPYNWPKGTWKDVQHHWLSEKCKSKLQWRITHQSEWSSSKSLQIMNTGEGLEKREASYTAGKNTNWYNHYGEEYGGSLKNLK